MRCAHGGFSLVEVLVAMTIFSIVSLATSTLMTGSLAMIAQNAIGSEAIGIAQGRIEAARNIPDDMLINTNVCPSNTVKSSKGTTTFTLVCTVLADTPTTGTKTIRITVNWNYKGKAKSYATETIFTKITRS